MKGRDRGFSFRGFVALADLFFAVSAGMLLLNPIQIADDPGDAATELPELSVVLAKIERAESTLPVIEQELRQLETMTAEYFKNNKP